VSIVTSIVNDLDETVDAGRNFKLNLVHALDAKHFACNHALALSRSVCTRLDVCKYLCIHVDSGYLPRIEDNGREPRFLVMQRTCQPVRSNLRRTICRVGEEEDVGQLSRLRAHSRPLGVCALLESGKRGLEECYQAVDVGLYLSSLRASAASVSMFASTLTRIDLLPSPVLKLRRPFEFESDGLWLAPMTMWFGPAM
jgi:hypothetical protein